ncbi:MAG: hypothetical protein ACKVVP_00335, partial [Chloroflexota bacterium]
MEEATLAWLESAGWRVRNDTEIAPGDPCAERDNDGQVALAQRQCAGLARLDPARAAYDALETNDSAVKLLGDETLRA